MAKRAKELKIELTMDVSAAERKSNEFHEKERARIKADVLARADADNAKARSAEQAHQKIADSSQAATEAQKGHWQEVGGAQGMSLESLKGYAIGLAGVAAASEGLKILVDQWNAIRRDSLEAAINVSGYRDRLKELAALKEGTGRTQGTLMEQAQFRAATLMSGPDAARLSQEAFAAAELTVDDPRKGIKGTMTREDFQKITETAGKMQTLFGGDPAAYGKLAGTIPLTTGGKRIGAEEGQVRMEKLFELQKLGGFKDVTQALNQFQKASSLSQAGVYTPEEQMMLQSVLSVAGGEDAATKLDQLTRLTSASLMRARGMKVDESVEFETSNKFFKDIGISQKDSAFERMKKLGAHLSGKMKNEPGLNIQDYLLQHGLTNQKERDAAVQVAGVMKGGGWGRLEEVMTGKGVAGGIDKTFEQRVKDEPTLQMAMARQGGELKNLERGLKTEGIRAMQMAAFERLKGDSMTGLTGTFEDWEKDHLSLWNTVGPGKVWSGRVNREVEQQLVRAGRQVGVSSPAGLMGTFLSGSGGSAMGDEQLTSFKQQIEEAGGNPMAEAASDLKATATRLSATVRPIPPPMAAVPKAIEGRP
jgi:hypothetical protein